MKRYLLSLLAFTLIVIPCVVWGATYPITLDGDGLTYIDGDTFCSGVCQPDDILILPAGTTNDAVWFCDLHGTDGHPIVIRNADNGADGGGTIIDLLYTTNPADYRSLAGMKIHNSTYFKVDGSGDTDVTYGIKITKGVSRGIWTDVETSDFEIQYLEFTDLYDATDPTAIKGTAIRIGGTEGTPVANAKIHNCRIYNTQAEGMYLGDAPASPYTAAACHGLINDIEVYDNEIEDSGLDGIDVKCATGGASVYGNTIINPGWNASVIKPSDDEGISIATGSVAVVYGNYIEDATGMAIRMAGGVAGQDCYNNVIVNPYTGIAANANDGGEGGIVTVRYNTIINPALATYAYGIYYGSGVAGIINSNLIINENGLSTSKVLEDGSATAGSNVTKATIAECNFVDSVNDNYDLTATSPFINSGSADYDPATDYLGRSRPSGGAPDPGAFEYQFPDLGPSITAVLPGDTTLYSDGGAGWNNISVSSIVTDNLGEGLTYLWTFGIEYITNGTMEAPVSDEPPTGWTANNATLDDSATAHGGAQSIKITNNAGAMSEAYQAITTIVGAKYRVSGWAYKAAATGVSLRVATAVDSGIIASDIDQSTDNTWFNLTFDFTATATTTYIQLGVYGSADDGSEFAYFDDITMDQISIVEDPGTITYPTPGSYPSPYTVTYLVTDDGDNTDQATFTVTINETSSDAFSDILFFVNFESGSFSTPTYTIDSLRELSQDTTGTINSSADINADAAIIGTRGIDCPTTSDYIQFDLASFPSGEWRIGFWHKYSTFSSATRVITIIGGASDYVAISHLNTLKLNVYMVTNAAASQVNSGDNSVPDAGVAYYIEIACKISTNYLAIFVNGSDVSTGRSGTLEAHSTALNGIRFGQHSTGSGDIYLDNPIISNLSTRNLYTLRNQTILPSAARIGSIGNTDINGTYGIGASLSVPVYFVDGLGSPKTVTLTDDGDTAHEAILTTETGDTDLVLLHTSPALGTAASTHWFSTTATAGQAIASGMTSADLAVTAISAGQDSFNADLTLPTGENLSDNSAVVIAGTANSITAFYLCNCTTGAQITDNTAITDESEFCALMTFAVDSYYINGPTSNLTIPLLLDNGTLIMTPRDTQPTGMGNGTNEWVFSATASSGDRSATEVTVTAVGDFANGDTDIVDGMENALASYELPNAWLVDANELTVNVPYTVGAPLEIATGETIETLTAAKDAFSILPGDHFTLGTVTEPGALDLSGDDGGSGTEIVVTGTGATWAGDITFGDFWITSRVIHNSTVTLGLGNTHQLSVIPSGDGLTIPAGATGCNVNRDTIAGTFTVGEDATATGVAISGTVALANGKTLTAVNCYFAQSEATIEGDGGTVDDTNCVFGVADFGFFGASDFRIKGTSVLRGSGVDISETTDIRGITIPWDNGYDVGAYEYQPPMIFGN